MSQPTDAPRNNLMMKRRPRAVFGVLALLLVLSTVPRALPRQGRHPRQGRTSARRVEKTPVRSARSRREEAYRANNLGVALLEQFRHSEGADAFRRALALAPDLSLARINLAVALYNVPDLAEARREAERAAREAPRAPQPRYLLGLIAKSQNRVEDALREFQSVLADDPRDVGANVQLGQLYAQQRRYAEAVAAFRTAVEAEPYNGTALYNLATALLRSGGREEGQRLLQRFQELRASGAATVVGQNYLEQGRYAEAVTSTGAESDLVERATPPVRFVDATAAVLRSAPRAAEPPDAPRRRPVFGRHYERAADYTGAARAELVASLGGGVALLDFDGDGDLDLFDAAPPAPHLRRNDGGRYVNVTAQSGALAGAGAFVGAVAGDFDNDGRPDLFVLRDGANALYRNEGGGRFGDVTAAAGIPPYPFLSVSAAFADVDHDGDLDIFVAGFVSLDSPRATEPNAALDFPADFRPAPNVLLRNNGDGKFSDITAAAGVAGPLRRAVAVVPTDYDNRRDVDLLTLNHDGPPSLFRNLRDGTFRDVASEVGINTAGLYFTSVAAGDANKDGYTDFFLAADGRPADLIGRSGQAGAFAMSDGLGRFTVPSPPAYEDAAGAAQLLDYDNDGLPDLLMISDRGVRVWRNVGDGWADVSDRAISRDFITRSPMRRILQPRVLASGDVDGDGDTDIFVRAASGELRFLRNEGGNRNRSVSVRLEGKASNRTGVGAKVEARAGSLRQRLETYAATPAPAPADIVFGLGRRDAADAVRVLWPSGVVQAETEIGSETAARGGKTKERPHAVKLGVTELDRKPSSCPYLYAWNGSRFEFVTDFMGGGELGYWAAPGVRAAPDPEEYVRIRGDQLRPRGRLYELRVTNELEEALFVDRLQLLSVTHPAGVEVYPNEGLGNPTSADFKLYATRGARPPARASDDDGRDVLAKIVRVDRQYPDGFRLRKIRGYAEEHALTLDLGGGDSREQGRTLLLMTGWTDYAFSSDNVAAAQAGLSLSPPALQVKDGEGKWRTVIADIGVPVGRPQTVAVDLTGKFLSASREVRVVTNMRIYWDQILLDTSGGEFALRVERLEAVAADLRWRGFSAETSPDGREPYGYDYARVSHVSPWKTPTGRYTREGDVRELLAATDDLFVVSRPGDEMALAFDASALAPLPPGWARTFLLYADGFSKEMDINSASPDAVAPLPFHGMKSYPYSAPETYPMTAAHLSYLERYNTRVVAAALPQIVTGDR